MFSIAIAYWGDVQIELIRAENDEPSINVGEYAVKDRLHHICIFVDSIEDARAALALVTARGCARGKDLDQELTRALRELGPQSVH